MVFVRQNGVNLEYKNREELKEEARTLRIPNRSRLRTVDQLERAIGKAKQPSFPPLKSTKLPPLRVS